ncbi:MAG TPA: cupredoxin domain-containing protein [Vicinamibacterales bacterium]|jgi:heme/copper-type cytochrome/quinol oxidase subunit 2
MRYLEIVAGLTGILLMTWSLADGAAVNLSAVQAGRSVKEITVVAERFKFTPDRIEVNQGDVVRLVVHSADGTHGLAIKKLKQDVEVPKGGKPVTIEFVADLAGTFPITCSEYCGRGHKQMTALLVVNPASAAGAGSR